MKLSIKQGTTSKLAKIFVQDTSKTDGSGLAGLTSATSGLTAYYIKEGDSSATAITLASGTVGTWSSGGFKEVDATHMPGTYEIGLPNAALSSGNSVYVYLQGAAGMAPAVLEIEIDLIDYAAGKVSLDLTQAVPTSNTGNTVGDALNAARADGFGKWVLTGTTLNIYASDGTTVVRTFTLDSATAPTQRT